jgi:DNA repair photolyase
MSLLKPIENGRMYPGWWRWNIIGGCKHGCTYCSIKRIQKRSSKTDMITPVLREDYLNDNLGSDRKIFCCSSGDAWGAWVESSWILKMLDHCLKYPKNEYMFLTKNPVRFRAWTSFLHNMDCIIGATIETDIDDIGFAVSGAIPVSDRLYWMKLAEQTLQTMFSIEPVMKFSEDFWKYIEDANPDIVYIGVDSGSNGLPEPSADELAQLIIAVGEFTEVYLKKGVDRILGKELCANLEGRASV